MHRNSNLLLKSLAVAGVAEIGLKAMTGNTLTGLLMSSTGLNPLLAFGTSVFVWGVGMTAGKKMAERGLSQLGAALGTAAAHGYHHAGNGLKAVRMMIFRPGSAGREPVALDGIGPGLTSEKVDAAHQLAASQRRPIVVEAIMTQEGWTAFVDRAKASQIRVVDLDGIDESKARKAGAPFESLEQAAAEIERARGTRGISVDDAHTITQRTSESSLDAESKRLLYKVLGNELEFARTEIKEARAIRDDHGQKAELAVCERNRASLDRLRENHQIEQVLKDTALFHDDERIIQNLQRSVAQHGIEETLRLIDADPESKLSADPDAERGTTREAGRTVADVLSGEPEVAGMLRDYVTNVGSIRRNASEIVEVRERQAALDAQMVAREEALATVERRIEQDARLLDPLIQRQILTDSLKAVMNARETTVNALAQEGTRTGEAEIQAVENETASGHTGAEQLALAFSHLKTVAMGRFSEAHPGPVAQTVEAIASVARGSGSTREQDDKPQAGGASAHPGSPQGSEPEQARKTGRAASLRNVVSVENDALGEILRIDNFGGAETQRAGGRDIKTRSRRRAEVEMSH